MLERETRPVVRSTEVYVSKGILIDVEMSSWPSFG